MISQVTFTVGHDETTDYFQDFVETVAREYASGDIVMMNYTVEVDIICTANLVMDNGDRLCTEVMCPVHKCDAGTCDC